MKYIISVILFAAVASGALITKPPISTIEELPFGELGRIISGEVAAVGQFPWQVANRFTTPGGSFFCGGALICDSWVLTAAHCAKDASHFTLYLGSVNQSQSVEPGRVVVETTEAYVHENYNQFTLNNDIALIHLKEKVSFNDRIQAIPLGTDRVEANSQLTVSGWGKTSDASGVSPVLNFVDLTTISNKDCENVYGSLVVKDGTLCCKGRPEHSTCNGDSGGPLVGVRADGKTVHVGVVSFVHSAGCASGNPSGYVRTASYIDWIKEKIGGTCTLA